MRVAITGASGYIGSLLLQRHVARGDTVHALVRPVSAMRAEEGVSWFRGDLASAERIPPAFFDGVDVLYHCAAELTREPLMQAVNVDGTHTLLAAARGRIRRWVQVSTVAVYGRHPTAVVTEETPPCPEGAYARSKFDADQLLMWSATDLNYTVLRASVVIGPRMRNRAIYALLEAIHKGIFFLIGQAHAIAHYLHEENLIDALLLCGSHENARRRIYNISQDEPIEDVVATLAAAIDRAPPRMRVPERVARVAAVLAQLTPRFPLTPARIDALTDRTVYATTRIEHELGYRHRAPIEDALRALARSWESSGS